MPRKLCCFSMLEIQGDVYVFGGLGIWPETAGTDIYKLSCSSGNCIWSTLKQKLKIARRHLVAIPVKDDFYDFLCKNK